MKTLITGTTLEASTQKQKRRRHNYILFIAHKQFDRLYKGAKKLVKLGSMDNFHWSAPGYPLNTFVQII